MKRNGIKGVPFKQFLLLFLLTSTVCLTPSWAEDEEAAEEKTEQTEAEKKEAEEKKKAEQEELKTAFSYTFDDVSANLVIIECRSVLGRTAGSGFIAKMDGKTYIFTNQHVIMGADSIEFRSVSGEELKPKGVELSVRRDIARLPIDDREDALEISDNLSMDLPLAVFGNSEGGGVATELYGKVTGVGADLVEVSAEFVSGNSGSPVLTPDRTVIGIASYVRYSQPSKMKEGTQFEDKVRRFCYRLNDVKWAPVNWRTYNEKYGKPYLVTQDTVESVFDIINGWYEDPFGPVPTKNHPDISLTSWSTSHNKMVERIAERRLSRTQLNKVRDEIQQSAHALSNVASRMSTRVSKQAEDPALTGFLRDEFEGYAASLESASEVVEYVGDWIAAYIRGKTR